MKFAKLLFICVAALASTLLQAHTSLTGATPADGAVLHAAPASFELAFSENVRLLKFDMQTDGRAQPTGFTLSDAAAKTFSIPLPTLAPAAYEVSWTILGADGHRVEGKLGFTVDPAAAESAGNTGAQHSH